MFKSAFYFALYGAIAGAGWFVYDAMENDQKPLEELRAGLTELGDKITAQTDGAKIYRWKNAEGNWEYGTKLPEGVTLMQQDLDYDYQAELARLKNLPKDVLPVDLEKLGLEVKEKDDGSGFYIPGFPSMEKVAEILEKATDIQAMHDNRKSELDTVIQQ